MCNLYKKPEKMKNFTSTWSYHVALAKYWTSIGWSWLFHSCLFLCLLVKRTHTEDLKDSFFPCAASSRSKEFEDTQILELQGNLEKQSPTLVTTELLQYSRLPKMFGSLKGSSPP